MRTQRLERRATRAAGRTLAGLLLAALGPFAVLVGCGRGAEPPARPNVILISLDTLRADHLGCYGYPRDTSPRIDALAASGVRFAESWSPTSWTLPAHLSMLTGLAISAHGVCDDRLWEVAGTAEAPEEVPIRGTFLPEVFTRHGYETAGFYTYTYLAPRFGFGPGFDVYERIGHSVWSHPEWSARFDALRAAEDLDALRAWHDEQPEIFDEGRPTADQAVDAALAWLDGRSGERPFFLFLHLFDIHDDYAPPPPFDTRFDPDYDGPIDGRRVSSPDSPVRPDMDPRDLDHLIALYDGEIAWVDSQVGRVFAWLEEAGLAGDTLVVVTSDHGEEFFEHGDKQHRRNLHRESVHVPLVLSWPGVLPEGRVVEGPTGLVDVAPTILGLAGLPALPCANGRDLSAVAPRPPNPPPAVAHGATNPPAAYTGVLFTFPPGGPERHVALAEPGRYVLVVEPAGEPPRIRYFDRDSNPRQLGPGEPVRPDSRRARELSERLQAERAALRDARGCAEPRGTGGGPLSAAELRDLANMGYAGGVPASATASDALCLDGCVWAE